MHGREMHGVLSEILKKRLLGRYRHRQEDNILGVFMMVFVKNVVFWDVMLCGRTLVTCKLLTQEDLHCQHIFSKL
jgi:hypothetical protein